ncbi:MAG: CoA transferase, partial [Chloroflexi bacterium]|nr:CoA transferase [Chloroflexota bacterium]
MTAAESIEAQPGPPPLDHLVVVDLTTELGTLACRFLSGFGATVMRLEPPGGDPLRAREPLAEGHDGQPVSLYWLHMMAGRDCRVVDLESGLGRAEFRRLLAGADVVIESQPVGRMDDLGIGYDALRADFPNLIWTSITPFGRTGPRAAWAATDLIGLASGGLMSLCGDPGRAPVRPSVEQGYAQAGAVALAGTLAALHARNATGRGQLVDVSMQEAIANCLGNARLFFEFEGIISRRAGGSRAFGEHGSRLVYPCADGYVAISRTPGTMAPMHAWIRETAFEPHWDADEWAKLPQSGEGTPGPEKSRELEDDLTAFFALGKKMDLYEEGQQRAIMICPVSTPADLLQNQQLAAREFFTDRYVPELRRSVKFPGAPVQMSRTPWRDDTSRHHGAVRDVAPPTAPTAVHDSRGVLAGIRIADFSWVGVGPIATQLLGGLGAEVIRVESTARLDVFRSGGPRRGDSPPDASAYFANCNRDKLGINLNLSRPGAREVALRLAARSDVLVESFRPGVLARLGLAPAELRLRFPRLVLASLTGWGQTGPWAQLAGHDLGFVALAGMLGHADPAMPRIQWADLAAGGLCAALRITAALAGRAVTGEGDWLDVAML